MIQLNQVRCFVTVAKELHFGRAAERLHMTQPPLSRQIQQLEQALGVLLMERDRRHVKLTPAGLAFLAEAEHLLEVAQTASAAARRAMSGETGLAILGYVPGISCTLLPPLMASISTRFPDVNVDLRELSTSEQIDALRNRRIDLGLMRMPGDTGDFDSALLMREPFIAALPAKHALARQKKITLQKLHHEPMVMYHPAQGGYFYELLVHVFKSAHVTPRYVQYARQTHSLLGLVRAGMGIALLPASSSVLSVPGVVYRPVALPEHAVSEIHLVWRKSESHNQPVIHALCEHILSSSLSDSSLRK
jgi:DNA-binding transcriptional LysR family regulator